MKSSNLWMIRSNQVMMSKFISCSVYFSDDAFLILMHRNYRNACWKSSDWSRARAAIYRSIYSHDSWHCRESTRPASAFRLQRPNTSHKHPICCSWCCLLRTSRTKRAFAFLPACWRMSRVMSIKREIKTSNVQCSQTQRDDLESTVLHGTVLILVIKEAELQHNLFPRSSYSVVCTSLCQAPRGPERTHTPLI